ncbi:MAG: hypothetical protein ACE5EG_12400 [Thermoanaerobaculia bacterium]
MVIVEIPGGALGEDTAIAVVRLAPADWPDGLADALVVGDVYDLQPGGLTFSKPVTITRNLGALDVSAGIPLAVQMVGNENGTWDLLDDTTLSLEGGSATLSGTTTHFSPGVAIQIAGMESGGPLNADLIVTDEVPVGGLWAGQIVVVERPTTTGIDLRAQEWRVVGFDTVDVPSALDPIDLGLPGAVAGRCLEEGEHDLPSTASGLGLTGYWKVGLQGGFKSSLVNEGDLEVAVTVSFPIQPVTCTPATIPDGAQWHFGAAYTPAPGSPATCGGPFANDMVATFGGAEDADGFLAFAAELEGGGFPGTGPDFMGRPFTLTPDGELAVDEFEFPLFEDASIFESFLVDPEQGTGTLSTEFSSTDLGDPCDFDMVFDAFELSELAKLFAANPDETEVDGDCSPTDTELCLNNGRFKVDIDWRTSNQSGTGTVLPFDSTDTGLFWFFTPNNFEVLIKVLDGCEFNDHFWVFAAGTTDVEYTLTVTDTVTGEPRSYENPLGQAAQPILDTSAFATCP